MFVTFGQVRNNLADLRTKDNIDKQDLYQAVIGTSIQELNDNVSAYRFACVVGCLLTLGWATQMSQGLSHDLEYLVNCNGPNTTWNDVRRTVMFGTRSGCTYKGSWKKVVDVLGEVFDSAYFCCEFGTPTDPRALTPHSNSINQYDAADRKVNVQHPEIKYFHHKFVSF